MMLKCNYSKCIHVTDLEKELAETRLQIKLLTEAASLKEESYELQIESLRFKIDSIQNDAKSKQLKVLSDRKWAEGCSLKASIGGCHATS